MVTILNGVDLTLRSGTVTGLVGESGAGKSTLALALLGHQHQNQHVAGRILIAGKDPFSREGCRAVRGRIAAYLPQDPSSALDPAQTVHAQLRTACRVAHAAMSRSARKALIHQSMHNAALEPSLLSRRPLQLSGGQAQRALLARTFVTQPKLLILDEPTSSLDPATAQQLGETFSSLPWRPAVLLISHDRSLVSRVSDRILEIGDDGRLTPLPQTPRVPTTPRGNGAPRATYTPIAPRLTVNGLMIQRGGQTLLRDAALAVGAGELVAIRGRSGCGKTSLARTLCGFAPPTSGTLCVNEQSIDWDAGVRARRGQPYLSYVGQDARAALHPQETVQQTLDRAVGAARKRSAIPAHDVAGLLKLVNLPQEIRDRTPGGLSGGQRQRLLLARALAAAPDVLVCDEVTASLDHHTAARILDTLDHIGNHTKLPVLLITHQDSVAARADRILRFEKATLS
ncbi:MAG: ABC transporter ATP-binding protein [Gulosibacter sp.]|uniref:ABC transporter ATP-binding protein n=1 Tax=Gulosibacter sp. TaxID=2817531 RepID=UPI003F8FCADC